MNGIGNNYPTLELLSQRPAGVGKVFFVDSGIGVADGEGTDPNNPLLTITEALDHCTASKGDAIIILQNSPSSPPATETFPINVNKAGVLIAGLYSRGLLSDSGFGADADVATLLIAANYVSIEGLYLGCDSSGRTGGIVEFTGNCFATSFRNCIFDTQYIATHGINAPADQPYTLIENCLFGRDDIAGYSTYNVYFGNGTCVEIKRNRFLGITAIAVGLGANCGNVLIGDNLFSTKDARAGEAITILNGATKNVIVGNKAVHGRVAAENLYNPFRDTAGVDDNHWGDNTYNGILTEPGNV